MKVLVYPGPGQQAREDRPDPRIIADTDAIVCVDTGTRSSSYRAERSATR